MDGKNPMTIIGIVGDAKQNGLREPAARRLYTPYTQVTEGDSLSGLRLEVRTRANDPAIQTTVLEAIHKADPTLRKPAIKWAQKLIEKELEQERLIAQLSGFFSFLALILAAIGLYGVMSYLTARRTTEVGVRMALGASRSHVVGLVLSETFAMSGAGLVAGAVCAYAVGKLTASSLYGVAAFDPLTVAVAVAIICGAALLAGWFPAQRAARVDPMVSLRAD
jgi:ABC-type antimicrobial peptide transport system permease subunit